MKIMLRRDAQGTLSVYVPKKDLEEPVVEMENADIWGGRITLANGWQFALPVMETDTRLPITVEARRLAE